MKGGIAAMLHAIKFIQEAGAKLSGDLTVETVPDEEESCMGTLSCCQRGYTACIRDKNDELEKSKDQAWSHVQETVNECVKASEKAGRRLKEWIGLVLKLVKPFG